MTVGASVVARWPIPRALSSVSVQVTSVVTVPGNPFLPLGSV
jgi:hypothetical protein